MANLQLRRLKHSDWLWRDSRLRYILCLLPVVRQDVAGALQQVVSEEQAAQRVLDPATHLHQVLQDVLTGLREGAHVHHPHGYQQVPRRSRRNRRRCGCIYFQWHVDLGCEVKATYWFLKYI